MFDRVNSFKARRKLVEDNVNYSGNKNLNTDADKDATKSAPKKYTADIEVASVDRRVQTRTFYKATIKAASAYEAIKKVLMHKDLFNLAEAEAQRMLNRARITADTPDDARYFEDAFDYFTLEISRRTTRDPHSHIETPHEMNQFVSLITLMDENGKYLIGSERLLKNTIYDAEMYDEYEVDIIDKKVVVERRAARRESELSKEEAFKALNAKPKANNTETLGESTKKVVEALTDPQYLKVKELVDSHDINKLATLIKSTTKCDDSVEYLVDFLAGTSDSFELFSAVCDYLAMNDVLCAEWPGLTKWWTITGGADFGAAWNILMVADQVRELYGAFAETQGGLFIDRMMYVDDLSEIEAVAEAHGLAETYAAYDLPSEVRATILDQVSSKYYGWIDQYEDEIIDA